MLISLFLLSNVFTEICKSLTAISKLKGCEVLAEWIKPCERHLYWSATSTFSGCGRVIWAKFKSFLNHVVNKHSGFDEPLFNKCVHRDIPPRKWLKVGMGIIVNFQWIFIHSENCVERNFETHQFYAFLVKYGKGSFTYHRLHSSFFPRDLGL